MLKAAVQKVQGIYAGNVVDGGFPEEIMHVMPLIYKLLKNADAVLVEEGSEQPNRYALDENFKKVSYFDEQAWLRFGIDFAVKHGKRAVCIDWKTGKNYGYNDQLMLMAAIIMEVLWQDVDEVVACYVYVDIKETSKRTFKREHLDDMWDDLIGRASAIDRAAEANRWPCQKNPFCRNCEATPQQCSIKGSL